MEQLNATGKGKGLRGFEMLRAVHLEPTEFSVENDLMTPSFKVLPSLPTYHLHVPDVTSVSSLSLFLILPGFTFLVPVRC